MSRHAARLTADQAIRVLGQLGFEQVRQSWSHRIFRNSQGVRVTIPYHKGRILHPKIMSMILKDLRLTQKDLAKYL
jgi:predicted RNA binding protein YcfA (HicA-like mRNA interferase family)